jgi:hypothetical protein
MRIRKRYWVPPVVLLAACGGCLSLPFIRYRDHVERDGWVRESSHAVFRCWTCSGRMERLTCNGQPIPAPGGNPLRFELVTPVGWVSWVDDPPGFRPYSPTPLQAQEVDMEITPQELARGWYDTAGSAASTCPASQPQGLWRKRGTPTHWCVELMSGRWVDPQRIGEIHWTEKK